MRKSSKVILKLLINLLCDFLTIYLAWHHISLKTALNRQVNIKLQLLMSLDPELLLLPRIGTFLGGVGELMEPGFAVCFLDHILPGYYFHCVFPIPSSVYTLTILYAIGDAYRTCFSTDLLSFWNESGGIMLLVNKLVHWDSKHWVWADLFFFFFFFYKYLRCSVFLSWSFHSFESQMPSPEFLPFLAMVN